MYGGRSGRIHPTGMFLVFKVGPNYNAFLRCNFYRPQTKFVKVMFFYMCVSVHRGAMHGRGACMAGEHAFQGGMHGRGSCMVGGYAWQGSMHGRGHAW